MRTALDMAKRLGQPSLRKIAEEVAGLNLVPIPKPLTLRQIMDLFAKIAYPEPPSHVANELLFPDTSPTLSPIHSRVTWDDPGAKSFRFASYYRCRISVLYDGGRARLDATDNWTRDRETVFQDQLNFDTEYKVAIMAYNDWGTSEWSWLKFTTYSNPNPGPGSGPGPSPGPTTEQHPSGFLFWNCDVSGVGVHEDVYFWLFDLTTGDSWNWYVASGYGTGSACPVGSAQIQIPSMSTIPALVAGNSYQWVVVKPQNEGCGGNNDPRNSACAVAGNTFTAGSDPAIAYIWTNT